MLLAMLLAMLRMRMAMLVSGGGCDGDIRGGNSRGAGGQGDETVRVRMEQMDGLSAATKTRCIVTVSPAALGRARVAKGVRVAVVAAAGAATATVTSSTWR
jgi:hypothetical protein